MAVPRIRWRREGSRLNRPAAAAVSTPSEATLGVFVWLAAAIIIALALGARIYNASWDDGLHLHPDERHLSIVANDIDWPGSAGEYFDTDASPLNPHNRPDGGSFVYGTFPLFLTKAVAGLLGKDTYDSLYIVGRHLSGVFDAMTVLFVFLTGRRLYGATAGLIGALLYASAPLAIQHAHFHVVDPFLTLFVAATLYYCVAIVQEGRPWHYALAGVALGLGTACKVTMALMLPVVLVAVALRLWQVARTQDQGPRIEAQSGNRAIGQEPGFGNAEHRTWDQAGPARQSPYSILQIPPLQAALAGFFALGLIAFLAFRIAQPYAFEAPGLNPLSWVELSEVWTEDQKSQSKLLGGDVAFPPSVQWIDRESYLYPLQAMLTWGMGPAFGLAGWGGLAFAAYRLLRFRDLRHLLPLFFVLVYFGFMGRQFSLYLRYFLPLYPVLAVLAGYALVELVARASRLAERRNLPALRSGAYGFLGAVLLLAMLAGVAYLSIYTRPVTRIEASRWLYTQAPDGARIATEHWDDPVPMQLPGLPPKRLEIVELPVYELDSADKVTKLVQTLDRVQYVTISSNRALVSIPRNDNNYPAMTRYYDLLLREQLGFRLLREFTSYPQLAGRDFPDHGVEEAWSSYDHPRVLVFEKTPEYSSQAVRSLLDVGTYPSVYLSPAQAGRNGLMLSASELETQRNGGTWTDVFSDSGMARSYPALLWLGAMELAALAVTPLALMLFRRLPDRGYLLSKPLGLLLMAYPVWLLSSLNVLPFAQTTILLVLAALLVTGAGILARARDDLRGFVRANWRLMLFSEGLFLLAFLGFLLLRTQNPDLWHPFRGGEKPMDLAFLTAVTRSTSMPPYDPWFAGGYINYYYLGQFFTATLSKLTAIVPEVAFNLAVPTYFALTVAGVFSVSYNLAAVARRYLRRAGSLRRPTSWSAYAAGLLGVFFVAVAGNFNALEQVSNGLSDLSTTRVDTPVPLLDAVVNGLGGLWQVVFHGASLPTFDYWRPSRMLPPSISITEFPYFSFLFADLHAHMMAIPFQVLALGLSLSLMVGRRGERSSWQEWGAAALLGLVVGSLRWLNSWDYPPFLLVGLAAIVISERRLEGGLTTASIRGAGKVLLLAGLSFLLFKPFLDSYAAPVSGLISSPETTPPEQYLAHFGLLLAPVALWLLFLAYRALHSSRGTSSGYRDGVPLTAGVVAWCIAVFALPLTMAYAALEGQWLIAMLMPAVALVTLLAVRELRSPRPDAGLRLFLLALVGLGLGLSIGVDLVTIKGDIERMNTVFKFYLHAWAVFAIVAAFGVWQLAFVIWRPAMNQSSGSLAKVGGGLAAGGLASLLVAAVLYPALATPVRLDDRFVDLPATLDGTAYMREAVYNDQKGPLELSYDYEGIQWLRQNVEGSPAIVEGRADLYRWGGRFSIYTGLPAVVGWDWHERQQRGELAHLVEQRGREVDAFYTSQDVDQAQRFLRRYSVQYVILGQLERNYYPAAGLRKLQSGLNGALEVAYENEQLTIYRVK